MWWGSDSRHEATQEALNLYSEKYPNVTITPEFMAADVYFTKLATLVAAGDPPDLMQMNYLYFGAYQQDGVWLALDDYTPDPFNDEAYDETVKTQGVVEGTRYAAPAGVNTPTIVYDPEIFASAEVEVPPFSWTWDDYERVCEEIVASEVVKYCSNDFSISDQVFDVWLMQRGKQWFTDDGKLGFNDADLAEFWSYFAGLRDRGLLPEASVTAEQLGGGDVTTSQLVAGNSAMEFAFTSQITGHFSAREKPVGAVPMPAGPGPGQYLGGTGLMWVASAKTEYPEQVADLINFLVNDPEANAILRFERAVPPTAAAREVLAGLELTDAEKLTVEYTSSVAEGPLSTKDVYFQNPPQEIGELARMFRTHAEQVTFGRQSASEAASGFVQEATAMLGS